MKTRKIPANISDNRYKMNITIPSFSNIKKILEVIPKTRNSMNTNKANDTPIETNSPSNNLLNTSVSNKFIGRNNK